MLRVAFLLFFLISSSINSAYAQEYILKKGDVIRISVWGEEDLDKEVTVDDSGVISYPLIGKVKGEGLSLEELDDKITELLKEDFFVNPDVTVTMAVLQFFITGEVKQPGAYPILGNITPLQAVTLAGGFTDFASHTVKIIRKTEGKVKTIKVNVDAISEEEEVEEEYILRPNDVIIIPRSFF